LPGYELQQKINCLLSGLAVILEVVFKNIRPGEAEDTGDREKLCKKRGKSKCPLIIGTYIVIGKNRLQSSNN